jgi:hypothetical protein
MFAQLCGSVPGRLEIITSGAVTILPTPQTEQGGKPGLGGVVCAAATAMKAAKRVIKYCIVSVCKI